MDSSVAPSSMAHPLVGCRVIAFGAGLTSAAKAASQYTVGRQRVIVSATRAVLPRFAATSRGNTPRAGCADAPLTSLCTFARARTRARWTSLASSTSYLRSASAPSLPTCAPLHSSATRHAVVEGSAAAASQQRQTLAVQTSGGVVIDADAPSKQPQPSESGAEPRERDARTATEGSESVEESREGTPIATLVDVCVKLFYAFCMLVLGLAWVCVFCYAAILCYMFYMLYTGDSKDE